MLDYGCEIAFRSDTRRLPNGQQLRLAMNVATNVGESQFWSGFTHGRHRKTELLASWGADYPVEWAGEGVQRGGGG